MTHPAFDPQAIMNSKLTPFEKTWPIAVTGKNGFT
jgi:hypothetical protein